MKIVYMVVIAGLCFSCKSTTYYISRHAEKSSTPTNDPPLTAEGEKQALDLRDFLAGKNLIAVYSTNFVRTKATAAPSSLMYGVNTRIYNSNALTAFADSLRTINSGKILVVGHSNTVDDLVNRITGANHMTDLADSVYGNVFIVKKKGSRYTFSSMPVPRTTPR